jgi:hypothetical protein
MFIDASFWRVLSLRRSEMYRKRIYSKNRCPCSAFEHLTPSECRVEVRFTTAQQPRPCFDRDAPAPIDRSIQLPSLARHSNQYIHSLATAHL